MRPEIQISLGSELVVNYAEAVRAFGWEALPAYLPEPDAAHCAGLILAGGADVDPSLYGQNNTACYGIDPARDAAEYRLIEDYVRHGKPILGICRGHQILNVFFGGTLYQNLDSASAHVPTENGDQVHETTVKSGSFLAELYGDTFPVNSAHHQGIESPAPALEVIQWASDGVAEACRHESLPIWSVQWHPERMCLSRTRSDTVDGGVLFRWFLNKIK